MSYFDPPKMYRELKVSKREKVLRVSHTSNECIAKRALRRSIYVMVLKVYECTVRNATRLRPGAQRELAAYLFETLGY